MQSLELHNCCLANEMAKPINSKDIRFSDSFPKLTPY